MFYKALSIKLIILSMLSCGYVGLLHAADFSTTPLTPLIFINGDKVKITVLNEDELNHIYFIERDGAIAFPMLGKVKIAGMTPKQTEQKIGSLLRDGYILHPEISIEAIIENDIYILGAVQNPGRYHLPERTANILNAVALAGGFTQNAHQNDFEIVQYINGEEEKKITNSGYSVIKASDIIIVKENSNHEEAATSP